MDDIIVWICKIVTFFLILVLTVDVAYSLQPGSYNSRDWNAVEFESDSQRSDPGGGMGSAEGMRAISYRIDPKIKPGKKMLSRKAAWDYIGDIKKKLLLENYTAEILLRTKPDPKHNTLSDGVVFNTNGGRNYYITRKDGEHVIMLDVPGGREELKITEANFAKFENAMHDDNETPYVLFDRDGSEAAIVFVEWHTRVEQKFNKIGEVIIILVRCQKSS